MKKIVNEVRAYFDVRELVSKAVWQKYGESSWRFFDPRLLAVLLALRRDILRVPLVCNNWSSGGTLQQRGLRENVCEIVKAKTLNGTLYLSAHSLGMAVDLSSGKMTADQMRDTIQKNAAKLPYKVRIEGAAGAPTWLHIDVATDPEQVEQIKMF